MSIDKYKSTKDTTTLTIGELSLRIKSADTASQTLDTATAVEFDVEVIFAFHAGWKGISGGAMEDGEPGEPDAVEVRQIIASSNVHFQGNGYNATAERGADLTPLFTGAQISQLEDKILAARRAGDD